MLISFACMSEKVPGELCLPSSAPRRGPCLWLARGQEAAELSLARLLWANLGSQAVALHGEAQLSCLAALWPVGSPALLSVPLHSFPYP